MYQADFICTYKLLEDSGDQEQMYRIQMLQAFDLNEWNDEQINTTIKDLFLCLAKTDALKDIYKQARENASLMELLTLFSEEEQEAVCDDIIFSLLFKFEYFDMLHRCIVDFLLNGAIHEKYATKLFLALQA